MIKLTVDGVPGEHFAVIAGLGVDAMITDETSTGLKDAVGAGAYFIAAAKALGRTPIDMRITVDDHRPYRRHAMCDWQCRQAGRESYVDSGCAA